MSDDGHVFRAVTFAQSALVFFEDDVQDPVEAVLYAPVTAHRLTGLLGVERRRRDVIPRFESAPVG